MSRGRQVDVRVQSKYVQPSTASGVTPLSTRRAAGLVVAAVVLLSGCATSASSRGDVGVTAASDSAAAAAIARERGTSASTGQSLGVTPFRLTSSDATLTALGYALADLLTTDLSRSAQLQLVERARLGEVLRELDLVKSGRVDS
ncbi:MAG: CsgG/HfaB family protein, partial [Gemmatimonadaceae bacterium]